MTPTNRRAAIVCSLLGIVAGALLGFGPPRFQATPSLRYLHQSHLPWLFWSLLFFAYAALLLAAAVPALPGRLGVLAVGWWLGAAIYGCFLLSLIKATRNVPTNPPVLAAMVGFVIIHVLFALSSQRADATPRR